MKVIDDRELNTEERWQLLEQVGNFSITPASLIKRILKSQNISYNAAQTASKTTDNSAEKTLQTDHKEVVI